MYSLSNATAAPISPGTQRVSVSRSDRWPIYFRLQELMIPCWCLSDGTLHVDVQDGVTALLVRSVVQQCVASQRELVDWLERCWDIHF